jgi:hypothetical protein
MPDFNRNRYILTISVFLSYLLYVHSESPSSCPFTKIVSVIFVTALSWLISVLTLLNTGHHWYLSATVYTFKYDEFGCVSSIRSPSVSTYICHSVAMLYLFLIIRFLSNSVYYCNPISTSTRTFMCTLVISDLEITETKAYNHYS